MMITGVQQIMTTTANMVPWVELCGKMAPVLTLVMFAAPIPTIREIQQKKSVQQYPLLPYSSMMANTVLWSTYGILKSEPKIWTANALGLVLATIYSVIYNQYSPRSSPILPGRIRQHVGAVCSVFLLASLLASRNMANTVGRLAVIFCIAMFGSPLSTLAQVLRDRSAASIPLAFAMVSGLNCLSWSVTGWWGMATRDWNVVIPNMCGLSFAIAQLVLKVVYRGNSASENNVKLAM